ncbi:MAG TPA: DsbA family protein [Puia sp.]
MLIPLFDSNHDNYSGNINAPIELVEYGDFQCEYCANVYPVIRAIQDVLGSGMRFIFRHFPFPRVYSHAIEAAVAAEAAGRQGKFWAMHNLILENQKFLTHSSYSWFAEEIKLNIREFEQDRGDYKVIRKISNDLENGVKSGVNCTPTLFINRIRYTGFTDFKSLYHTCLYVKGCSKSKI